MCDLSHQRSLSLFHLLFNYSYTHTLFSSEVRCNRIQTAAMSLICYDFIFPIFNVLIYEMGDITTCLTELLRFEIMCAKGAAHDTCYVFKKQKPTSTHWGQLSDLFQMPAPSRTHASHRASRVGGCCLIFYLFILHLFQKGSKAARCSTNICWMITGHTFQSDVLSFFLLFHNKKNTTAWLWKAFNHPSLAPKKVFLFNFKNLNYKIQARGKKWNHHKRIKWKVGSSPHIQSPHPEIMF